MECLKFLFGVHCHQPLGNFGFVFEKAYNNAYLPFFEILKEFPEIKVNVHFSGCLLDWLLENKLEFIDLIKNLLKREQVEILGGGYYEPILPIIPEKDQLAQLKLMKNKLKEIFNREPEGAWIAERVWEPTIPYILEKSGYKAVFLDDFHLLSSGLKDEEVINYFETYHLNQKVKIFPIKERYRYLIPFAQVEEVLENLKRDHQNFGNSIITMIDDGEKFGIWPGTYKWVYEEKWLYKFFKALKESDFVKTVLLKECLKFTKPKGIIHIPTQSYFEMGEWTLPSQIALKYKEFYKDIKEKRELKPFLKGGYWRNFFEKYEESLWIYKRMVSLSNSFKNKTNIDLLKAQCNCGWWHGIFGGLYLPFLRREIFSNLIKAGKNKKRGFYKEKEFYTLKEENFQIFLEEKYGGIIREIDLLDGNLNITDLIKRRIETYHLEEKKESKEHGSIHELSFEIEESFKEDVIEDPHPRVPLILHFFNEKIENLNEIEKKELKKVWEDNSRISKRGEEILIKSRTGEMEILKIIKVKKNKIKIDIKITKLNTNFWGVELPFSFPNGFYGKDEENLKHFSKNSLFENINELYLYDKATRKKLKIKIENPLSINIFPLNTIAKCEKGFEKILQGIIIFPLFSFKDSNILIELMEV